MIYSMKTIYEPLRFGDQWYRSKSNFLPHTWRKVSRAQSSKKHMTATPYIMNDASPWDIWQEYRQIGEWRRYHPMVEMSYPTRSTKKVVSISILCQIFANVVYVLSYIYVILHIEAETKWPPFFRRHFQMHFREWKMYEFRWRFHWSLFLRVQLMIYQHWLR